MWVQVPPSALLTGSRESREFVFDEPFLIHMQERGAEDSRVICRQVPAVRPVIPPAGSLHATNAIPSYGREASTFIYPEELFCGILGMPISRDVYGRWLDNR